MENSQNTLRYYESIKRTTGEMLSAAQRGDWDNLLRNEARCHELIGQLKAHVKAHPLSGTERQQKIAIIRQVLADDAAIRNLLDPWLAKVGTLLQTNAAAKKAGQAYQGVEG
jgi:flagellar protein FliT